MPIAFTLLSKQIDSQRREQREKGRERERLRETNIQRERQIGKAQARNINKKDNAHNLREREKENVKILEIETKQGVKVGVLSEKNRGVLNLPLFALLLRIRVFVLSP